MLRSRKAVATPGVGYEAPEFGLPSAQGGVLRLSMRTARGPVVVVFYRVWSEEDAAYFKALSEKEEEINLAAASVVGVGIAQPEEARDFVRRSGVKSYVLYDYAHIASREWGLLEKDKEYGAYARPAVFIVGSDRNVAHAWLEERPEPAEILAKVSEITGLPKPAEEAEEEDEKPKKPRRAAKSDESKSEDTKSEGDASGESEKPSAKKSSTEKPSPEEREKRRAERKAAREQGETSGEKPDQSEGSEEE